MDLAKTLTAAVDLFHAAASEKGLELRLLLDVDMPALALVDAQRVRQCVNNLIANAIKFTDSGSVTVSTRIRRKFPGDDLIEISVADTGVGMSDAQLSRLFVEFSQVDESSTRKFGGTGLGLAICHRLARLMGGDVSVESQPYRGSTFYLTVSLGQALAPLDAASILPVIAARPQPEGLGGVSVLLVDDNATNRKVARLLLAPSGVCITEAANGREALEHLARCSFDAVLMDVHMPVMDGIEALARIRGSMHPFASTPVIMLTADAMDGDSERYMLAEADGYVSKSIDNRMLLSELARALKCNCTRTAA